MADWKIINGYLPFKDDFAIRPTDFDDYPNWIWHKVANELPYKVVFPSQYPIDDAPLSLWKIGNGLPYRVSFPQRYGITDVPLGIWAIRNGELPYRRNFPQMPGPPTMWGSVAKLTLSQMHNSPILLKTQKSQDVQIGDTTIPHQITKRLFEGIDWELI